MTQTAHHPGSWDWDCAVALEYAAEQLLKVSQLSMSVIAPSAEALNISYLGCISSLLQHEVLLPETLAIGLRDAKQEYLWMLQPRAGKVRSDCLASRLRAIPQDVSTLLTSAKLKTRLHGHES